MATRRQFGGVRRLPSRRWQAYYTGPDLKRHTAPVTFTTKMDAESWLLSERELVGRVDWMPPKERRAYREAHRPPTLAVYAEGWLASRELKPRTRELYEDLLQRLILPALGELELPDITPAVVRNWHTALGPKRPTQRSHAYALLRSILRFAVAEQIIPANPCVLESAGTARRRTKTEPATLPELQTIVDNMPDRLQLAVLLAAWCGLRQGEVLELRRKDVDTTLHVIRIRRAVTRVAGEGPIVGTPKGATKGNAGERDVTVPPHIWPAVERHLSKHVPPEPDSLLFVGRDSGEQLASSTLYRWYYPAREAAGRPDLRWHDLRHTGATFAALAGATLPELQRRLGHSTAAAALRYQHEVSGRDEEIARRLSELAGGMR